jgi:hypothetical protein
MNLLTQMHPDQRRAWRLLTTSGLIRTISATAELLAGYGQGSARRDRFLQGWSRPKNVPLNVWNGSKDIIEKLDEIERKNKKFQWAILSIALATLAVTLFSSIIQIIK